MILILKVNSIWKMIFRPIKNIIPWPPLISCDWITYHKMHKEEKYICLRVGDHKHCFPIIWSFLIWEVIPRGHDLIIPKFLRFVLTWSWFKKQKYKWFRSGNSDDLKIFKNIRLFIFFEGGGGGIRSLFSHFYISKLISWLVFSSRCQ